MSAGSAFFLGDSIVDLQVPFKGAPGPIDQMPGGNSCISSVIACICQRLGSFKPGNLALELCQHTAAGNQAERYSFLRFQIRTHLSIPKAEEAYPGQTRCLSSLGSSRRSVRRSEIVFGDCFHRSSTRHSPECGYNLHGACDGSVATIDSAQLAW